MKILHTSDWHLGRMLYGKKRDVEFEAFLSWLYSTIVDNQVDILLVCGDIFDTTTPSHQAQTLYYKFLCNVANSCCQHIVIIAGNHDSPSFLSAPKEILSHLNVHIVGSISDDISDEVFTLYDENTPMAIICAVPYLRDKDIRQLDSGESIDDKNNKLIMGLKSHYHAVCTYAEKIRQQLDEQYQRRLPIIGMGHLFASGGITNEGDGVRDLYVGNLAHLGADAFPDSLDYVALGHLHVPQMVSKIPHIRYSGSPIAMGFGEAKQQKKVLLVTFEENEPFIEEIPVPIFQQLIRIQGNKETIEAELFQLKKSGSNAWLEIEYTGSTLIPDLRGLLEEIIEGSLLEIRRIKNRLIFDAVLKKEHEYETLEDITPIEVFNRCLNLNKIEDPLEKAELLTLYSHALLAIESNASDGED